MGTRAEDGRRRYRAAAGLIATWVSVTVMTGIADAFLADRLGVSPVLGNPLAGGRRPLPLCVLGWLVLGSGATVAVWPVARRRPVSLVGLLVAGLVIVAWPQERSIGPIRCEHRAIGQLRTLVTAQSLFRVGDKEDDHIFDYATLAELGSQDLIDGVLASGTKHGYTFQAAPGLCQPELRWMAVANPADTSWGGRSFCVNQRGVVHYAYGPIALEPLTCSLSPRVVPVGR